MKHTITIAIQLMLIKRGGSWYYYTDKDGNEHKFQGSGKLLEELRTNEPFRTELQNRINEVMYNV